MYWYNSNNSPIKNNKITIPLLSRNTTATNITPSKRTFTAATSSIAMKFNTTNTPANAVIGVRKIGSTEYLWSWHIWITKYNPRSTNIKFGGYNWMDRNLGARDTAYVPNHGAGSIYYQWGRKDPIPGSESSNSGTIITAPA